MDTKLIKQYGSEILCYRIKTARQKKRAVKQSLEKQLISLNKERNNLWKKQKELGFVRINPPVIRGWKRYFVLREDVARSNDGLFYQRILDEINTTVICNRKDFKTKKGYYGKRKKWRLADQFLKQPEADEFTKMNFSDKEKQLFEERYVKRQWSNRWVKVYVFTEPWRFVYRIRRNIITKVKATDYEMERRKKEIDSFMERNALEDKLSRLLGYSVRRWRRWGSLPKSIDSFEKKTLVERLDEIKNC